MRDSYLVAVANPSFVDGRTKRFSLYVNCVYSAMHCTISNFRYGVVVGSIINTEICIVDSWTQRYRFHENVFSIFSRFQDNNIGMIRSTEQYSINLLVRNVINGVN
jgi:hypothetical protein